MLVEPMTYHVERVSADTAPLDFGTVHTLCTLWALDAEKNFAAHICRSPDCHHSDVQEWETMMRDDLQKA